MKRATMREASACKTGAAGCSWSLDSQDGESAVLITDHGMQKDLILAPYAVPRAVECARCPVLGFGAVEAVP